MPVITPAKKAPPSTGSTMRYIAINSAVSTACTWLVWYYAGPIGGELARSTYLFIHGEPGIIGWAMPGHWYKWGYDWGEDIGTKFVAVSAPLFYWLSNKIQNAVDRRLNVFHQTAEELHQQIGEQHTENLRAVIEKFEQPGVDVLVDKTAAPAITAMRGPAPRKSTTKVTLPKVRRDKDSSSSSSSSSSSDDEKTAPSLTKKKKSSRA